MAKSKFIFQGFTARTHLDAVRRIFEVDELERVILSVAFANAGGVELLADQIEPVADKVTAFVGIRNAITSQQGLARLLELGADLYAVDTGSPHLLFHPKLYFARGAEEARLVIGSANLTAGGLNNNVEAGMATDLDLSDDDDSALAEEIEKEFDDSLRKFPDNIIALETAEAIQELQDTDRLLDETAIRARSGTDAEEGSEGSESGAGGVITRIKLLVTPIRSKSRRAGGGGGGVRATPAVPGGSAAAPTTPTAPARSTAAAAPPTFEERFERVWRSKPLTRRSLTIPTGPNSHPTGSTTLGKGQTNIDPVTYFRDDVFGSLDWETYANRAGNPAEKADADFELYIEGDLVGTFNLTLRHSSTRVAAADADKNVPTELSWNRARQYITRDDLIGRTMSVYRDLADSTRFAITID